MKILYSFAFLCVSGAVMLAKDIELQTSTTVTGKISVEKGEFYISNGDTVSGPGNGFHLNHEPVHNCILSLESVPPQKRKTLEEKLQKLAANGQPATVKGEFFPLNERAQTPGHRMAFDVKE